MIGLIATVWILAGALIALIVGKAIAWSNGDDIDDDDGGWK